MVDLDGNPWFVLPDVGRALGMNLNSLSQHARAVTTADEVRVVRRGSTHELRWEAFPGIPSITLISESGLYKYTLRAQRSNPAAAKFQDWVTREVLPAIRKDGAYIMGEEKARTGGPLLYHTVLNPMV